MRYESYQGPVGALWSERSGMARHHLDSGVHVCGESDGCSIVLVRVHPASPSFPPPPPPPAPSSPDPPNHPRIYSWQMSGKLAWVLQELPAFAIVAGFSFLPSVSLPTSTPARVLLGAFLLHYFHRYA